VLVAIALAHGLLAHGLLATSLASPAGAQSLPVELREGELAASVGMPLEVTLVHALRALPVPLTLGASVLPLVEGGSVSVGLRPVLARFADHRVVLASSLGATALGLDGLSLGGRADLSLQFVFTAARLSDSALLVALVPGLDAAVVGGGAEGWRLRAGAAASLGLSWAAGALWLEGEAGATFDGVGAPALRGAGRLVGSVRL
jgi:hypothetical protein